MAIARILFCAALLHCLLLASAYAQVPPSARRVDTVDRDFGLAMPDPYRWMEGEDNDEFKAWIKAQGTASRAKLDALPTLAAWRVRLTAAAGAITTHSGHRLVGKTLFFLRAVAGAERKLMVRQADGREHVIYDPASVPGSSVSNYRPSPDGRQVTLNIGHGGNEIGEIALLDVANGKPLAEPIKPVWSEFNPYWLPDGSGFFYTRMRDGQSDDADPLQGMGAYLHRIGQPQASDRLIAQAGADDGLKIAANDFPEVNVVPGSDWALLQIVGARASARACVAPLTEVTTGKARWRCLVDDPDQVQGVWLHGDTLYLLQAKDAPNRRVLALDLREPHANLATGTVVVAERVDVVLTELDTAREALYVKSMRHGLDHIERMDYADLSLTPVALPGEGSIYLMRTDPRQEGALVSLEGWTTPRKVYRYQPDTHALIDTGLGTQGAPDYPDLIAEEIQATSADGTQVPLSVVRDKQLPLDGSAQAIVQGYGGYGVSQQPFFSTVLLEWAKAGNVGATCHVRGGGENGDAWRIAGSGPNKQRGVEDFIACAKTLAERGYTRPPRTAGFGGSMGGLLVGGAYTTAPDAWGAMVVQSGMFNPVRILAGKNGANQVAEIGDPRTEAGMRQLLAMDPYQHVRDGTHYPPLLLVTGAVDQRVPPSESGKFGARVMAASPTTPVWFRTDDQFGHFATNANAQALEMADIFAFVDRQLQAP